MTTDANQAAALRRLELADKPAPYRERAAWHARLDALRQEAADIRRLADLDPRLPGGDDPAALYEQAEAEREQAERLARACARVGETARQVAGCIRSGFSAAETADLLDISRARVYAALKEIRAQYVV